MVSLLNELKICEICGESFGTNDCMSHFAAVCGSRYSFRESNYNYMIELMKLMLYLKKDNFCKESKYENIISVYICSDIWNDLTCHV